LLSASRLEDFEEHIGMFGAYTYIYIYIYIILFRNEFLVLNPEKHINRLLGYVVFTAFKVASYLQEHT